MNSYLDIIIRSVSVYVFMIVALRVFGRKELSQLNTADVILILLISNSVQNAMVGSNATLLGGLVAASALFLVNLLFKKLMSFSQLVKKLAQDTPEILVHNGKVQTKKLAELGISTEELEEAMREHGVENYSDVKLAMFEIDGNISIISGSDVLRQTHHKKKIHKSLGNVGG